MHGMYISLFREPNIYCHLYTCYIVLCFHILMRQKIWILWMLHSIIFLLLFRYPNDLFWRKNEWDNLLRNLKPISCLPVFRPRKFTNCRVSNKIDPKQFCYSGKSTILRKVVYYGFDNIFALLANLNKWSKLFVMSQGG